MPISTPNHAVECDIGTEVSQVLGYAVSCDDTFDPRASAELWADAADARVFNHPEWWAAAIEAFGRRRPLRVISVHQGGRLVAIWPMWLKRLGAREGFARILEPVGMRATDYCLPLVRAGQPTLAILDLMLRQTVEQLDAQTILLWAKMPAEWFPAAAVHRVAGRLGLLEASIPHPCPAMALPAGYDELQRRWSKSHRGDVRRQIRRLSQAGSVQLVTRTERDDVVRMLPALTAMHSANWRARSGAAELEDGPMGGFLSSLVRRLPSPLVHASELRLGSTVISYHLGFSQGDTLLWYKPAFDIAWANYAPGKVHIALAAEQAIGGGIRRLDFLQGNEPYKKLWSDVVTETNTFVIARPIAYPLWSWNTKVRRFAAEYRY